jgi:putative hydrolase of the HAD superfamily
MQPDARAVVFDLDDTLYPLRRYRLSGFSVVASHAHRAYGADAAETFTFLVNALDNGLTGHEIDALARGRDWPADAATALVEAARAHDPVLLLPAAAGAVLTALRPSWKLGILTNGPRAVQVKKIRALGLDPLVDAIVFATEHGSGAGKPDAEPFLAIARTLEVAPSRVVFVGDDERCDVGGAAAVGMKTVRLTAWTDAPATSAADAVVGSLTDIPALAGALLRKGSEFHAA